MRNLAAELRGKAHVIWDWNGTLLDDVRVCVEVIGEILAVHGKDPLGLDDYLKVFRFPVREYYRAIGFDFEQTSFETLTQQFVRGYAARLMDCSLFEGCRELLAELRAAGIGCSVLSAAHERQLNELLAYHGIAGFFDEIFGIQDFYAASKIDRGHQLIHKLEARGIHRASIVLVGDTDHDAEVGHALGVDVILLSGGHQCPTRLDVQGAAHRYVWRG
jgi:phosphoglycolate phosphatase